MPWNGAFPRSRGGATIIPQPVRLGLLDFKGKSGEGEREREKEHTHTHT